MVHESYNAPDDGVNYDGAETVSDGRDTAKQKIETFYSPLLCGVEGPRADMALQNKLRVTDHDEIVRSQQASDQIITDIDDYVGKNYPTYFS